jgi:hypothetical protein
MDIHLGDARPQFKYCLLDDPSTPNATDVQEVVRGDDPFFGGEATEGEADASFC